ncbi:MAG: type II toxin-antitoxin system HicA family toxin [Muribaculaceae bacterium]|nr:type II toxin-antitoxin system HicA family toxin [Muribaculaceae bacterium]
MNTRQFCAELSAKGCFVVSHGGRHDTWFSPITNKTFQIPRHPSQELGKGLECKARKVLGI